MENNQSVPDAVRELSKGSVDTGLYVVATPIGNVADISLRALEVLKAVDLVAAEDTRHSLRLLNHYSIRTQLVSFHDHSSEKRLTALIHKLQQGLSIALISDAGTPAISDPGFELVRMARQQNLPVYPVPGASSLLAAMSVSGIPSDRFVFEGFLPSRAGARARLLKGLSGETRSIIFFESPRRIVASLQDIASAFGAHRQLYLGRELTKLYETSVYAPVGQCIEHLTASGNECKGEFVLVLAGCPSESQADSQLLEGQRILNKLLTELSVKKAVKLAAEISGASKNTLYQLAISRRDDNVS